MRCPNCRCEIVTNAPECPYCGFDLRANAHNDSAYSNRSVGTTPTRERASRERVRDYYQTPYDERNFFSPEKYYFENKNYFDLRVIFVLGIIILGVQFINLMVSLVLLLNR